MKHNIYKSVGKLLWPFSALIILLNFSSALKAENTYTRPDFAFPVQVEKGSAELLDSSLDKGDQVMALRALINLCVARNELQENEGIKGTVTLIDSVATKLRDEYRSLAYLIEARVLAEEYGFNRYLYNQRNLPMDVPFPADPMEWSGEMFKTKIFQLVKEATKNIERYRDIPLSGFQVLLTDYDFAEKQGFSMSDFMAFISVNVIKDFATPGARSIIPFFPGEENKSLEQLANDKAKSLLDFVIDSNLSDKSVISAFGVIRELPFIEEYQKEKFLNDFRDRLKNTEGEALLDYELWRNFGRNNQEDNVQLYGIIERNLKEFPDGIGADKLRYALSRMGEKRMGVSLPQNWIPDEAFEITAELSNISKGYILIYRLNESQINIYGGLNVKKFNHTSKPYHIVTIDEGNNENSIPYNLTMKATVPGLPSGIYVAIPSEGKSLKKDWDKNNYGAYSTFSISGIAILTSNDRYNAGSGKIFVVDSRNQKPVEGAVVTLYKDSNRKGLKRLKTGADGSVSVPSDYYYIEARYRNDMALTQGSFYQNPISSGNAEKISLLTDLSIYRPGDELQFVAIGWRQNKEGNIVVGNKEITVEFRDANFKTADTLKLTLDESGRCSGKFVIPEGSLLGTYRLMAFYTDSPRTNSGSANVEVADYKLPPFEVRVSQENTDKNTELRFKGYAATYSGMPVGDAEVRVTIDFSSWNWGRFRNEVNASFTTTVTTNSEGIFELNLPTENLKGTVFENGVYFLRAEVVSSTGEQVSSSPLLFYLGYGYRISPSFPDKIEIKGNIVNLYVPVYDMAGLPVQIETRYRFVSLDDPEKEIEGTFVSPSLDIESSLIASGRYRLEFSVEDKETATTETVFWRQDDQNTPYPTPLWVPVSEYVFSPQQKEVNVRFGSYWEEWILFTISDASGVIEQRWLEPLSGMREIIVATPDEGGTYFVTLAGMHDFEAGQESIEIVPAKSKKKMKVETISFRENIGAGDSERWSFKFRVDELPAAYVNAVAVMSDKALNALVPFHWNLSIQRRSLFSGLVLKIPYFSRVTNSRSFSKEIPYPGGDIELPSFETYGYVLVSGNFYRVNGPVYYKMSASRKIADTDYEMAYDDASVTFNASMNEVAEESATTSGFSADDEGGGMAGGIAEKEIELRPIEMPLAFFMPDLKGDGEGIVNIDFMVPDFNTTWQFQLLGYNSDMLDASILLDAEASKSVMVKSNIPQYLITGDRAEVSALLFNNSDAPLPLGGRIVVLNSSDGSVIAEKSFEAEEVVPSGNRVISLSFGVTDNLNRLAVRCYASAGTHTDGEQGFIPVYPSFTPVIEAKTFYANTNEERVEIKLPKFKKDANVTLKYCDNPLWEALLALPMLKENSNGGALSTVRSLYAVLMANDIISSNEGIAEGLERILTSEDTTLSLSNLQKDENLKAVALQATPWVNDAEYETERIQSLESYLSPMRVQSQIERLKGELKKLQNSDGGWSWFEGFKSSPYITSSVINVLGYLSQAGILDSELRDMALKGIRYYDKYLEDLKTRNIELPINDLLQYFYSRGLIKKDMSKDIKEIHSATLEKLKKEWRFGNLAFKAVSALLMLREESYRMEVKDIMTSMKEFLNRQHPLFEEAWALILFNQEEPDSETTERLRELIYLQKETEDWGSNPYTAGIIHALIVSTPSSLYATSSPEIYADGKKIELPGTQALTGNFTVNLDARTLSGKTLVINRSAGIPAWGGVISQFVQPVKDVKGASVEDLKVDKQIYLITDQGKSKEITALKKGDKVRVVLNISCGKDMDYVALIDERAACLQASEQLSGMTYVDGTPAYREVRKNSTSFFIEHLTKGKYVISYECAVEREGDYSLGITTVQSLYSPAQVAHSAGKVITVK